MATYTPVTYDQEQPIVQPESVDTALHIAFNVSWILFLVLFTIFAITIYKYKKENPNYNVTKESVPYLVASVAIASFAAFFTFLIAAKVADKEPQREIKNQQTETIVSNIATKYDIEPDSISNVYRASDELKEEGADRTHDGIYELNALIGEFPTDITVQFQKSGEPFIIPDENVSKEEILSLIR